MKYILYFCLFGYCLGHPDRIRYSDPEKQREYEEHCRIHKGYKILNGKLVAVDPKPTISSSSERLSTVSTVSNSGESSGSDKKLRDTSSVSSESDTDSIVHSSIHKNLTISTSSSSSPSSVPSKKKRLTFASSGWFWNEELGWVYIAKSTHPYFYSAIEKEWKPFVVLE